VRIVATDLNEPMLNHAAAQQSHDRRIVWRQADAPAAVMGSLLIGSFFDRGG